MSVDSVSQLLPAREFQGAGHEDLENQRFVRAESLDKLQYTMVPQASPGRQLQNSA